MKQYDLSIEARCHAINVTRESFVTPEIESAVFRYGLMYRNATYYTNKREFYKWFFGTCRQVAKDVLCRNAPNEYDRYFAVLECVRRVEEKNEIRATAARIVRKICDHNTEKLLKTALDVRAA